VVGFARTAASSWVPKQACGRGSPPSHFPPLPPLRHPAHPCIQGRVHCGWPEHGRGRVRVPGGWCGRGHGYIAHSKTQEPMTIISSRVGVS